MVYSYCKCCQHMAGNTDAAANFYNANFIPDSWKSNYSKLSECAGIILVGHCKDCYGYLEELIPIPKGLSGDALFQAIYNTMQSAHPYAKTSEHTQRVLPPAGQIAPVPAQQEILGAVS